MTESICEKDDIMKCSYPHCSCGVTHKKRTSWKPVEEKPAGENRILTMYNPEATFDTGKVRQVFYRSQEGFPKSVTHWKEKILTPEEE